MNKRYLGAALMLPLLIFIILGGAYLKYGVMILSLFGMYEFYKIVKEKNINAISYAGFAMCLVYYFTIKTSANYEMMTALLVISTLLLLCVPVINLKYTFIDVAITIMGFLYVAVFFSFVTLTNYKEHGNYFVWIIFISSWMCDTTAYYVGRFLGKNKLCPKVSPKKTIEGSIGGLLGSAIGCGILGLYINSHSIAIPVYHFVVMGLLCGAFCQFGDLIASSIKRYVGVKDYSNLIPGHGGILDRFDSILFSSVIVYYYLTFIIGY